MWEFNHKPQHAAVVLAIESVSFAFVFWHVMTVSFRSCSRTTARSPSLGEPLKMMVRI
jgi:hypothetical protein